MPYAELRVAAGGYGFEKSQLKFGGETERLNYLVSVSDQQLDGYRAQSTYENKLLSGRFDVDLGKDRSLLTVVSFTDQPVSDDPGGLTAAVAPVQSALGGAVERAVRRRRIARAAAPRFRLHDAGRRARHDQGSQLLCVARLRQPAADAEPRQVDLERDFVGGGVSYTYDGFWLDRPNRFITGVDFDDQSDDRLRYDNVNGVRGPLSFDQNEHVKSYGAFLQNELSVSERVQLSFGVRLRRGRVRGHGPVVREHDRRQSLRRRLRLDEIHRHEPDDRSRRRAH